MKIKGRQQLALFLFLLGMICLLSGTSYAFYEVLYEGRTENKIEAGSFAIAFENKSNAITLENTYPMSDEEGNNLDPFRFSITNNGSLASRYQLSIEEDSKNTLSRGYLKYSLKRNDEEITNPSTLSSLIIVEDQTLEPSTTDNYELRIWIDYNTGNEAMNKVWKGKVKLVAHDHNVEYIEDHVAPTIKLAGSSVMTITKDETFIDPGVESVSDNVDTSIDTSKVTTRYEYYDGEKVSTVNGVDTTTEGVYIIYYEIKDENGNKGVVARTINVVQVNESAPTITLVGNNELTYAKGSYYVEQGATAIDEQGTDISNQIIVIHNINLNIEEDQIVKYFVIDKDGNIGGKTRTIKVVPAYKDGTNANEPKIVEGMIPVKYDDGLQKWVKVDMIDQWYNYESQEWANAVTVSEKAVSENGHDRAYYQTAPKDTPIEMEDINTMWVWIPRYEYDFVNIQTAGGESSQNSSNKTVYLNPGEIKIKFISKEVTSADEANYKVHPAFDFGGEQLKGFWYGKFDTSNKEKTCNATSGSVETECDLDTFTPEIKPGVKSWRGIRLSTAFEVSRKMQIENYNIYGFANNQTSYDTHMSKNSEWGAVAYLSQSKYGKYGNDGEEVYINNCANYITGIAGATASANSDFVCKNTYETTAGQKASTTGNITGVYDMSGGADEHVMGALDDGKGKPRSGNNTQYNSGFNGLLYNGDLFSDGRELPDPKYYDLYTSSNPTSLDGNLSATACEGGVCYGHALSETGGWYGDIYAFVGSSYGNSYPWFLRGGNQSGSSTAGVFYSGGYYGYANGNDSFRLVLVS